MDTAKCWELVRVSLPPCDIEEIEQAQPKTLVEYVTLTENVRDRERSNAHAWTLWRDALSEWAREQKDAREVLRALTRLNHRLGVWCACQVARTVLRYVPEGELRPRVAIETAERWVIGKAPAEECRKAGVDADAAGAAADAAGANAYAAYAYVAARAYAAYAAATAYATSADDYAGAAAAYAAEAYAYVTCVADVAAVWHTAVRRRLRYLCLVVADAINTMPWEV